MNCHFLAQIKRNCKTLWARIALFTALTTPIQTCEYYDDTHGYGVTRTIELYENNADIPQGWNGIEMLVKVRREGKRNNARFHEISFYALSKKTYSVVEVAKAIQQHWLIENHLHRTKDVIIGEDDMTLRTKKQVVALVFMNNVAMNVLKFANLKPTKDNFAKFANKVNELHKLFQKNDDT